MSSEQVIIFEEDRRTQQLAAAKKKLSNFRARGSDPSQSAFSFPTSPLPLTTELSDNCPRPAKGKEAVGELDKAFKMDTTHKRQASASGHRRRPSSISISHSAAPLRTSVTGLFDSSSTAFGAGTGSGEPEGHDLPCFTATPPNPPCTTGSATVPRPTPIREEDPVTPKNTDDDTARAKFTSFSFGSKPSPQSDLSTPLTTLRERGTNRSPNHSPRPSLSAPGSLFMNRLSTPVSRPPSLLVTRPTPLHDVLASAALSDTPPSPPTPARKRHSHTRSNSISMPNLKLGRPQSYSVLASSPSFPSSPVSPDGLVPDSSAQARAGNGRKLKFEPSGRGAEAEQQRDESRRKALEKLTGQRSPTIPPPLEAAVAEISLPSMDEEEEDTQAAASYMAQAEPERSGLRSSFGQTSSFGRHGSPDFSADSSPISPIFTPSTWTSPPLNNPPAEQWSHGNVRSEREEFLGLGVGLDTNALKRASMPSALGVLTEEDESEEGSSRAEISIDYDSYSTGPVEKEETPVPPTPSRLRELHLVSSSVHASPSRPEEASHALNLSLSETPANPGSGRRPRPLSGLGHAAFGAPSASPSSNIATTPKSASALLRRRSAGSGSRGSSISYRKDSTREEGGSSTGSSREWSFGRMTSPTAAGYTSPPPTSSGQFANWPRPDSTTQGYEGIEELASPVQPSTRWSKCPSSSTPTATIDRGSTDRYSSSMTESSDFSWRDSRLELEMERDALREDAELWRSRCLNAEEHLKAERGETAILRERVRKLGDRLSSVSSSHLPLSTQPTDDQRPLNEMRDQLFSLMSLVEREQREKQEAIARISELESQLNNIQIQSSSTFRPVLPSLAFGQLAPAPPSPIITPATPLPSSPAPSSPSEGNGSRMKSWGFPSGRRTPTPPKEKRRESFFGLSTALRGAPVLEQHSGIDLPPISLPGSIPMAKQSSTEMTSGTVAPPMARSNSMTSSASSVVHFFSGYLGRGKSSQYNGDDSKKGVLDLRGGCSCCTGEVFEL